MYRPSDPQKPLFDAGGLLPPDKRERCEKTWAGPFRERALPILRTVEGEFADLYHPGEGRPNRPVELVLGTLLLKEMSDLTDAEALDALEYDARWWYALGREPHETHLCQKTLHNFRTGLIEKEKSKLTFRRVTDELIAALGIRVDRQRLDSTHILSRIALLSRLGLFCETIRLFLRAAKREDPAAFEKIPASLLGRHGEAERYGDARPKDVRRRLGVVARDVWRLMDRFRGHATISETEEGKLLKRLFEEHCVVNEKADPPGTDDDDRGDGAAPVEVLPSPKTGSASMQTPHDPDVTYSGHKGKGYESQVAETCTEGNAAQMITEVEVTPSCGSDAMQTIPVVKALAEAGLKPKELVADTGFGGVSNAAALSEEGVTLVAPVPGPKHSKLPREEGNVAPEGPCPQEEKAALAWLRQQEAAADFPRRYAIRAGIESTNAELKHRHGMKKLRVRGEKRVKLSVYLKAAACNLKRALRAWLAGEPAAEGAALA